MEYVEIILKVPKGYENQIQDLVMIRIEGILSQLILSPSVEKQAQYELSVSDAYKHNGIAKKK